MQQKKEGDSLSTNYYCRNKKEHQEWLKKEELVDSIIAKALNELKVLDLSSYAIQSIKEKIKDEYENNLDYTDYEEFHIGKRSSRVFNLEVQPNYSANLKSLFEWLEIHKNEYEIIDEYEQILTIEELKQIISDCEQGEKWLNYSFS